MIPRKRTCRALRSMLGALATVLFFLLASDGAAQTQRAGTIHTDSTYDKWTDFVEVLSQTAFFRTSHPQITAQGLYRFCNGTPGLRCNVYLLEIKFATGPNPDARQVARWRDWAGENFCAEMLLYADGDGRPARATACSFLPGEVGVQSGGSRFVSRPVNLDLETMDALLRASRVEMRARGMEFQLTPQFLRTLHVLRDTVAHRAWVRNTARREEEARAQRVREERERARAEAERRAQQKAREEAETRARQRAEADSLGTIQAREAARQRAIRRRWATVRWVAFDMGVGWGSEDFAIPVSLATGLAKGPLRIGVRPFEMLMFPHSSQSPGLFLLGIGMDGKLMIPVGNFRLSAGGGLQHNYASFLTEQASQARQLGSESFWTAFLDVPAPGNPDTRWGFGVRTFEGWMEVLLVVDASRYPYGLRNR